MEQLKKGQEFKNYKELCRFLTEPEKGGKAKKLQLEDWQRRFAYERQGHRYIITEVYDTPMPKIRKKCKDTSKYTSNNCKNIAPIVSYIPLECKADQEWHGKTAWFCDVLGLMDRECCAIPYKDEEKIKEYCKLNGINDPQLMTDWISVEKQTLWNMLNTSLRSMEKKGMVAYQKGYHFAYRAGERTMRHAYVTGLEDKMAKIEGVACDVINETYKLDRRMKGKRLLMKIYRSKFFMELYKNMVLELAMGDTEMLETINGNLDRIESDMPDEMKVSVGKNHPILFYNEVMRIDEIEEAGDPTKDCDKLAEEATKAVIRKAWKQKMGNRNEFSPSVLEDIAKTNQLLFKHFDESMGGD